METKFKITVHVEPCDPMDPEDVKFNKLVSQEVEKQLDAYIKIFGKFPSKEELFIGEHSDPYFIEILFINTIKLELSCLVTFA